MRASIFRSFAIGSAVVLLIILSAAAYLHHRHEVNDLIEAAETNNVTLAKGLSEAVWTQFADYLAAAPTLDPDLLADRPETGQIDALLRPLIAPLALLKVKIYSLEGLTLYSSDPREIGRNRKDNEHAQVFASAAQGRTASALTYKHQFTAFSGEVFQRDVVETYVPLQHDGRILAIFEIYADVTTFKGLIDSSALMLSVSVLLSFPLLYGLLVLVVMRRALAPLRAASQQAAAIGPHAPGLRLTTDDIPVEVRPLVEAINAALDRLDQALAAQRRFTGDAAHELLTPLAVLRANIDTLGDTKSAGDLRQEVTAMSDVVNQLLELSELETMEPGNGVEIDLREICTEVVARMAPIAIGQQKSVAFTGPAHPVMVVSCPKAAGRALRNLIENAIDHTGPETTVEVELRDDAIIRVIDKGPGVPLDQRDMIFQRFWRGPDRRRPGVGLGLAIVKQFVQTYQGELKIDDAPGGGAIFSMRLPLVAPDRA